MKSVRFLLLLVAPWAASLCLAPPLRASPGAPPPPPEIQNLFSTGYYRSAVSALEQAASAAPNDAALPYWLGRSFYELHDYGKAVSSLERAIAIDPHVSEYHEWLGRACGRKAEESRLFGPFISLGLARRAEREFTAAVQLDAANITAQRDLIRFLINAPGLVGGSEERAQAQIQNLAVIDPLQSDLARAELLAVRKRFDEAGQKYQQILAARPASLHAYLEIAEYYRGRGDAEHILQTVKASSQAALADARLLYYRGVALVMMRQDPARAEECLRKYLAAVPDNSEDPPHASAHDWLGQLYASQGKPDQAVAEYRAEVALDPHNRAAHEELSRLQKQH